MQSRNNTRRLITPLLLTMVIALVIVPAAALDISTNNPPSSTPTISQGDSVFVHGTATGRPAVGLQIWLIGNNYARVTNVAVNNDNTFEYELKKADTQNLASGQYFVLIQHPMMNGQFDITYNAATGMVTNQQLGGGTGIFQLTGAGSLQGSAGASALMRAVGSQNVDDTFTTVSFFIQPPNALIDPIKDHTVGDVFTITGSTNLAVGDNLMVDVYSSSFMPTSKSQPGEFSGASGMVQVQKGNNGLNRWSFDVNTSAFRPDEYIVTVSAVIQDVRGSSTFRIVEHAVATAVPTTAVTTITTLPTLPLTTVPVTTATTRAPLTVPAVLAGLLVSFALWCTRDKL